jgi:transcriptional regulator with XRE-family HTH domain
MTLLLREAIGGSLRRARTAKQRTLRDVSRRARVSLGYLSEVERGRKEASSELLAAICDALDLPLPDLLGDAAETMRPVLPLQPVDLRLAPEPSGAAHQVRLAAGSAVAA